MRFRPAAQKIRDPIPVTRSTLSPPVSSETAVRASAELFLELRQRGALGSAAESRGTSPSEVSARCSAQGPRSGGSATPVTARTAWENACAGSK